MRSVNDSCGRMVTLTHEPRRIVSLVPSWTETLFALGAGARLVGVTDYCVEPAAFVSALPKIGGTKNPQLEAIRALDPDLVIANVEENRRADVQQLETWGIPVYVTFARTYETALNETAALGALVGAPETSALVAALSGARNDIAARARHPIRVFVAIWREPWMTANGDTFISDMLALAGGENIFRDRERRFPLAADLGLTDPRAVLGERDTRYPRVSLEEIAANAPELVLLPDEPYPFSRAERDALGMELAARGLKPRIVLCDGKMLSWYGARMGAALRKLYEVLHGGETDGEKAGKGQDGPS